MLEEHQNEAPRDSCGATLNGTVEGLVLSASPVMDIAAYNRSDRGGAPDTVGRRRHGVEVSIRKFMFAHEIGSPLIDPSRRQ